MIVEVKIFSHMFGLKIWYLVIGDTIDIKDFSFRKFVDGVFRFFLVGIVTGNPSSCFPKTLPDVYNFIGNQQVTIQILGGICS